MMSNLFVCLLTHVLATKHRGQSSRSLKVKCCGADTEPCDAFTEADASIRELISPDEMCVIL